MRSLLAVFVLSLTVILSWCAANQKWNAAEWKLPTAYGDLDRSDVLQHLAFIKAAKDGNFQPFRSKMVPELGAPGQGNWNDWPIVEECQIYAAGQIARVVGIFAALNIALLLGHLLAALSFFFVARYSRVTMEWALVGGLAFGLAPFLFAESPHHPFVQWCWHLPLFLLVWRWVVTPPGVSPGSKKFWFGVVVGLLAGFQMVYYTAIFCQLVLLGAVVAFARQREIRTLLSAFCFIAAAAVAFALMNVDTWTYQWEHGANAGVLVRPFRWLEIYGLNVANFFVPPLQHHWEFFRVFAERHLTERAQADEGSYLGLVGAGAFLLLVGTATWAVVRRRSAEIPLEAWQVLWVILCFMSGGVNTIGGLFGFTLLRTGCRYSVVILVISLLFAAQKLSAVSVRHRFASMALALAVAVLVWWDQVPRPPSSEDLQTIAGQVSSDRKFVAAMEASLPAGAMVFQIPVVEYPEAQSALISPCDHFRPYLYSDRLHFSFGTNKGREDDKWQHELEQLPLDQLVKGLKDRKFSAVYINLAAYADHASSLVGALQQISGGSLIQSDNGDLACVRLK